MHPSQGHLCYRVDLLNFCLPAVNIHAVLLHTCGPYEHKSPDREKQSFRSACELKYFFSKCCDFRKKCECGKMIRNRLKDSFNYILKNGQQAISWVANLRRTNDQQLEHSRVKVKRIKMYRGECLQADRDHEAHFNLRSALQSFHQNNDQSSMSRWHTQPVGVVHIVH